MSQTSKRGESSIATISRNVRFDQDWPDPDPESPAQVGTFFSPTSTKQTVLRSSSSRTLLPDLSAALFAQDEEEGKEGDKKEDDDKSSNEGGP